MLFLFFNIIIVVDFGITIIIIREGAARAGLLSPKMRTPVIIIIGIVLVAIVVLVFFIVVLVIIIIVIHNINIITDQSCTIL